jgi:hypothetical protein
MPIILALFALIMGASLPAIAQTSTPTGPGAAGQARPTRGPEQTSVPNNAPAATTGQTTAERNPNPTVQQMNQSEKSKVEAHGK